MLCFALGTKLVTFWGELHGQHLLSLWRSGQTWEEVNGLNERRGLTFRQGRMLWPPPPRAVAGEEHRRKECGFGGRQVGVEFKRYHLVIVWRWASY